MCFRRSIPTHKKVLVQNTGERNKKKREKIIKKTLIAMAALRPHSVWYVWRRFCRGWSPQNHDRPLVARSVHGARSHCARGLPRTRDRTGASTASGGDATKQNNYPPSLQYVPPTAVLNKKGCSNAPGLIQVYARSPCRGSKYYSSEYSSPITWLVGK